MGLNDRILESLGLDIGTKKGKWNPSEATPLCLSKRTENILLDISDKEVC